MMYKGFAKRLGWVALGSIGTIIGLVFGNMLPLFAVSGGEQVFDTIGCKQLLLIGEDNKPLGGLGAADFFSDTSTMKDSSSALVLFGRDGQSNLLLTNSQLGFSKSDKTPVSLKVDSDGSGHLGLQNQRGDVMLATSMSGGYVVSVADWLETGDK
ncbi:MAG: hypothetical protein OXT74_02390, partial [Candidatus Poribacteria bacterium]|nr:hypothetical protein [Candidatus Poribacteria bacterium]